MTYEMMTGIHAKLSLWGEDALWDLIDTLDEELARAETFGKEYDDVIRFIAINENGKNVFFTVSVEEAVFMLFDAELQLERFVDDETDGVYWRLPKEKPEEVQ